MQLLIAMIALGASTLTSRHKQCAKALHVLWENTTQWGKIGPCNAKTVPRASTQIKLARANAPTACLAFTAKVARRRLIALQVTIALLVRRYQLSAREAKYVPSHKVHSYQIVWIASLAICVMKAIRPRKNVHGDTFVMVPLSQSALWVLITMNLGNGWTRLVCLVLLGRGAIRKALQIRKMITHAQREAIASNGLFIRRHVPTGRFVQRLEAKATEIAAFVPVAATARKMRQHPLCVQHARTARQHHLVRYHAQADHIVSIMSVHPQYVLIAHFALANQHHLRRAASEPTA